eukprot:TRINITY_DN17634_c0_g1_i1.p1 TRINITY_DN17634_c0_g1~~TRINITY_DN17634_c0_g1_i1.p1  ORF type:complete len:157 (+),score=26.70 TRINITY_DN17634_c0_g1_i1:64-534(+)
MESFNYLDAPNEEQLSNIPWMEVFSPFHTDAFSDQGHNGDLVHTQSPQHEQIISQHECLHNQVKNSHPCDSGSQALENRLVDVFQSHHNTSPLHHDATPRKTYGKKPMNAYLLFCKDHRDLRREDLSSKNTTDVASWMGMLWKQSPPEIREHYKVV